MSTIIDMPPDWRTRLQVAREPGFLAGVGAVLLMCAPVLPEPSRLVVLPALLLAPGYALLRLLGQANGPRSISVAVPVSLVLAVCASLVLDVSGVRLGPFSLGSLLGAVTALLLVGSYGRQLAAGPLRHRQRTPSGVRELALYELWLEGEATTGQTAVFSPTNAQSRAFEGAFIRPGLLSKVTGGTRFYVRREVRDLLAYLRLIANPEDELSLRRVLNAPRRGIGDRAKNSVAALAQHDNTTFAAALARPRDVAGLSLRAVRAIEAFNELLAGLRADADAGKPVAEIAEAVLERSGYVCKLRASTDLQKASRVDNLNELVAVAREFDAQRGQTDRPDPDTAGRAPGSLADFLDQVSRGKYVPVARAHS